MYIINNGFLFEFGFSYCLNIELSTTPGNMKWHVKDISERASDGVDRQFLKWNFPLFSCTKWLRGEKINLIFSFIKRAFSYFINNVSRERAPQFAADSAERKFAKNGLPGGGGRGYLVSNKTVYYTPWIIQSTK